MTKQKHGMGVYLWAALLILLLPLPWLVAAIFAAVIHELGHALAIRLCGGKMWAPSVGLRGMKMHTAGLGYGKELVCSLAGPAASLLLVLTYRAFPRLALCALVQGCFNLMPCYPMDGGRSLRCLAGMLSGQPERQADRIEGIFLLMLIGGAALLAHVFRLGLILPLGAVILAAEAVFRKNSLQT